jgi:hypothetical protein
MNSLRILSIEDFYADPVSLRKKALLLSFARLAPHLPAQRSTQTIVPLEMKQIVSSLLGVNLQKKQNDKKQSSVNGCFQLMLKSDFKNSYVHADHKASWATIVYLSLPSESRLETLGGTFFYRHRSTGLARFPTEESAKALLKDLDITFAELKALLKADASNIKKWEQTDQIGFRFNRFVLYDAKLFHKNGITWGANLKTGRLTHNFFI